MCLSCWGIICPLEEGIFSLMHYEKTKCGFFLLLWIYFRFGSNVQSFCMLQKRMEKRGSDSALEAPKDVLLDETCRLES